MSPGCPTDHLPLRAMQLPPYLTTLSLALCGLATTAQAELKLARLIDDHMVLQRETHAALWGWDEPGTVVHVQASWSDEARAQATAASDGRWQVELETPAAGGPFTLNFAGSDTILVRDVLIGEVWIASGQSNMEWSVAASRDATLEIAAADHPRIRTFNVARRVALEPERDVEGNWTVCTPETIASFSAVAYYFGRQLQGELDVPIGLIGTNWGGTVVEAWTSRERLEGFEEFAALWPRIDQSIAARWRTTEPERAAIGLVDETGRDRPRLQRWLDEAWPRRLPVEGSACSRGLQGLRHAGLRRLHVVSAQLRGSGAVDRTRPHDRARARCGRRLRSSLAQWPTRGRDLARRYVVDSPSVRGPRGRVASGTQ